MRWLPSRIRSVSLLLSALAGVAAGCTESGGLASPPGSGSSSVPRHADLLPGGTLSLSGLAGNLAHASGVRWTSRDAAVVSVAGETATAKLEGETYVVATDGVRSDSVDVVVHFAQLRAGDMDLRVGEGPGAQTSVLKGYSFAIKDYAESSYVSVIRATTRFDSAQAVSLQPGDSLLFIRFNTLPALGSLSIPPFTVAHSNPIVFDGNAGALLEVAGTTSTQYYVAVAPASLAISALTITPVPTLGQATITGRIAFQAAGLSQDKATGAITPIGDKTVPVFAEFSTPIEHAASSVLNVTLSGTPFTASVRTSGDALFSANAVHVNTPIFPLLDGSARLLGRLEIDLPPQLGTYAATPGSPVRVQLDVPATDSTPAATGKQVAGGVQITEYVAPTDTTWGVIGGTMSVTLSYPDLPSHPEYATFVFAPFRFAVYPTRCTSFAHC